MAEATARGRVLVAGGGGYLGRHLGAHLRRRRHQVVGLSRNAAGRASGALEEAMREGAAAAPVLIHLAGVAGRTRLPSAEGAAAVAFAERVATAARQSGIARIILASSIYAREPQVRGNAYGAHKLAVETLFRDRFDGGLIILRLPPVYGGDEAHSGMSRLWRLVAKGIPLPFGSADAPRDYLAVDNLAQLIEALVQPDRPRLGAGETVTYEPSDGRPIATRELVEQMARLQGVHRRLLPCPGALLRAVEGLTAGRVALAAAFGPLQTEGNDRLGRDTGWTPAVQIPRSLAYLRGRS